MQKFFSFKQANSTKKASDCTRENSIQQQPFSPRSIQKTSRLEGAQVTASVCPYCAVGWTQHTTGVQMIRAASILQLLLGNIGRPGGGIMAMRGHASIQGSTDIPTLYELLPGYIPQPAAIRNHDTLKDYLEEEQVLHGYWANFPKFMISLLKAWYGDGATQENQWGFEWIPKIDDNYSQLPTFIRMAEGKVKGLLKTRGGTTAK